MRFILLILTLFLFASCNTDKPIIDKPIEFGENRVDLTLQYIKEHYHIDATTPEIDPKIVVIHWTAIPTFEESFNEFKNEQLNSDRTAIIGASNLNVSSQFMVDRDGTIYRLMPENYMARHVIGLNYNSIGIENVGGTADTPLTKAQLESNIQLVKYLKEKYAIEYVIGHYQYTEFDGHEYWLEKDDGYRTEKSDPDVTFLNNVLDATKYLGIKNLPE